MKTDLVEVIGGVEAQMAGEAVEALRGAGIPVDVRSAAIDLLKLARPGRIQSLAYVYVAPGVRGDLRGGGVEHGSRGRERPRLPGREEVGPGSQPGRVVLTPRDRRPEERLPGLPASALPPRRAAQTSEPARASRDAAGW